MTQIPTHYTLSSIARKHEQHVCANGHYEPGICVRDNQPWPCETVVLLRLVEAQKHTGTLIREARAVSAEWTAYVGDWDKPGHDDAEKVGHGIARLRAVLDTIDGKRRDPLAPVDASGAA